MDEEATREMLEVRDLDAEFEQERIRIKSWPATPVDAAAAAAPVTVSTTSASASAIATNAALEALVSQAGQESYGDDEDEDDDDGPIGLAEKSEDRENKSMMDEDDELKDVEL